ncbi:hypothetical protein E2C01_007246 [Portunus trituberculatus]|uniref:Uncharacterized protein n=1 Tax=Portunus trituberculatus TaxID=210409 RepID=A0A5B7CYN7_PORTR|nr:hypothetical protein [Portunus trituberculatus]
MEEFLRLIGISGLVLREEAANRTMYGRSLQNNPIHLPGNSLVAKGYALLCFYFLIVNIRTCFGDEAYWYQSHGARQSCIAGCGCLNIIRTDILGS